MLNKVLIERKKLGITWDFLAEGLPIAGNSLRTAFKRGNVNIVYLSHVKAVIEDYKNKQGNIKEVIIKDQNGKSTFEIEIEKIVDAKLYTTQKEIQDINTKLNVISDALSKIILDIEENKALKKVK